MNVKVILNCESNWADLEQTNIKFRSCVAAWSVSNSNHSIKHSGRKHCMTDCICSMLLIRYSPAIQLQSRRNYITGRAGKKCNISLLTLSQIFLHHSKFLSSLTIISYVFHYFIRSRPLSFLERWIISSLLFSRHV